MTHRILILGGTTEARILAARLARLPGYEIEVSLAGRTRSPVAHEVPVRTGGFGGAEGLAAHLREGRVDLLVDATHPFAARISFNAAEAARMAGIPVLALRRPRWEPVEGDRWTEIDTVEQALGALGPVRRNVFVTLGRQELAPLEGFAQHVYLVRSVDPVEPPLAVPDATYLLARGPFSVEEDFALMRRHGIDAVLSKNSGGEASYAKIAAARLLCIPVFMVRRPRLPATPTVETVEEAVETIAQLCPPVVPPQLRGE